jgi:predicted dehydrogenase
MLGYAFMGKAHAAAYRAAATLDPPVVPQLVTVAGRDEAAVEDAARRYGFERHVSDWRELISDERIGLFDNGGPNNVHAEPTIAAAEAGKHVFCEKPLGRTAEEAHAMWRAAERAGVVHMCGFNHRFLPAVRLARELVEAGELGELWHFRVRYLQDWGADADPGDWRFNREAAGSGAVGDIGSHALDLARYLAGEVVGVSGAVRTFVAGREVDDAVAATLELESGAVGTLEATRFATGRRNVLAFELNGSRASLAFDLERLNELHMYRVERDRARGFRRVIVSDRDHPFLEHWWPPGHLLGWEHAFVHEVLHLLRAIAGEDNVAPHGATFEDGYRAAELCDALVRSAESGRRVAVEYRS